ncbi:J domain-containing protein [Natrialbaceae archaeon A-arb3/5]
MKPDAIDSYYALLDVPADAESSAIRRARRERLQYLSSHWDDDETLKVEHELVKESRQVLLDEDERERYDELGHDRYVAGRDDLYASTAGTADRRTSTTASTAETGDGSETTRSQRSTTTADAADTTAETAETTTETAETEYTVGETADTAEETADATAQTAETSRARGTNRTQRTERMGQRVGSTDPSGRDRDRHGSTGTGQQTDAAERQTDTTTHRFDTDSAWSNTARNDSSRTQRNANSGRWDPDRIENSFDEDAHSSLRSKLRARYGVFSGCLFLAQLFPLVTAAGWAAFHTLYLPHLLRGKMRRTAAKSDDLDARLSSYRTWSLAVTTSSVGLLLFSIAGLVTSESTAGSVWDATLVGATTVLEAVVVAWFLSMLGVMCLFRRYICAAALCGETRYPILVETAYRPAVTTGLLLAGAYGSVDATALPFEYLIYLPLAVACLYLYGLVVIGDRLPQSVRDRVDSLVPQSLCRLGDAIETALTRPLAFYFE